MSTFIVIINNVPEDIDIDKFYVEGHAIDKRVLHAPTRDVVLTIKGSVGSEALEAKHLEYDVLGADTYVV